jgi:hypothetical protein
MVQQSIADKVDQALKQNEDKIAKLQRTIE